jgi:hypothetical protein
VHELIDQFVREGIFSLEAVSAFGLHLVYVQQREEGGLARSREGLSARGDDMETGWQAFGDVDTEPGQCDAVRASPAHRARFRQRKAADEAKLYPLGVINSKVWKVRLSNQSAAAD